MSAACKRWNKEFVDFLESEEMYRAFLTPAAECGTWRAGSCWRLAHALLLWSRRTFPGIRRLATLRSSMDAVEHVVVELIGPKGALYLDSDGLSTEQELRARWKKEERLDVFVDWAPRAELEAADIPEPDEKMKALSRLLQARFGSLRDIYRQCAP